jgi:hypothetical protein
MSRELVECGENVAMVSRLPRTSTPNDAGADYITIPVPLELVRSNERLQRTGNARAALPPGVERLPRKTHDTHDTRPDARIVA